MVAMLPVEPALHYTFLDGCKPCFLKSCMAISIQPMHVCACLCAGAGGAGAAGAGGVLAGPPLALCLVCAGQLLLPAEGEAGGSGGQDGGCSTSGCHLTTSLQGVNCWLQHTSPALPCHRPRLCLRSMRQHCATSSARCSWTPRCPTPTRWQVSRLYQAGGWSGLGCLVALCACTFVCNRG